MIVTLVMFPAPDTPVLNVRSLLESTAPAYQEIPGLQRKYFVGNGSTAGGIYEWSDRQSAERFYNEQWRQRLMNRYGVEPQVQYFDAPCLVDNLSGEIIIDLPASS